MNLSAGRTFRFALVWGLVVLVLLAAAVGIARRDRLPTTVHIATGDPHGLYHQMWLAIEPNLELRLRGR